MRIFLDKMPTYMKSLITKIHTTFFKKVGKHFGCGDVLALCKKDLARVLALITTLESI